MTRHGTAWHCKAWAIEHDKGNAGNGVTLRLNSCLRTPAENWQKSLAVVMWNGDVVFFSDDTGNTFVAAMLSPGAAVKNALIYSGSGPRAPVQPFGKPVQILTADRWIAQKQTEGFTFEPQKK